MLTPHSAPRPTPGFRYALDQIFTRVQYIADDEKAPRGGRAARRGVAFEVDGCHKTLTVVLKGTGGAAAAIAYVIRAAVGLCGMGYFSKAELTARVLARIP